LAEADLGRQKLEKADIEAGVKRTEAQEAMDARTNAQARSAVVAALRPPETPEAMAATRKIARERDADASNRQREVNGRQIANEAALDKIDVLLENPALSPATRQYLEWQKRAWDYQRHQELAERTTYAGGKQVLASEQEAKLASGHDRDLVEKETKRVNKPLNKGLRSKGKNYTAKKKVTFDEIMGKEHFEKVLASEKSKKNITSIPLSPDHLVPVTEIANMRELTPLITIYQQSPELRREIRKSINALGDIKENLFAMRSDANEVLKGGKPWAQIDVKKAQEIYGYTLPQIQKMQAREIEMRAKIVKIIEDLIVDYGKKQAERKARALQQSTPILTLLPPAPDDTP
jgi:hypothetical protein